MKITFLSDEAFDNFTDWSLGSDKKGYRKLLRLVVAIKRDPYDGIGKPEPLKGNYSGYWSREITEGDRIVYRVNTETDALEILYCKGHYDDK
jgi:toxin YoeB